MRVTILSLLISMENIDSIVELSHVGIQEITNYSTGTFYIHDNYD